MSETSIYAQALISFMDVFIDIGGWLILFGLALAGVGTWYYGRGRAKEQNRIANLIDKGIYDF